MTVGIAKNIKLEAIENPAAIKKPPISGPNTAPTLPAPTAQPTPVALISVGYILAAKLYMPTNPPCIPNPINPNKTKTIIEPLKYPKISMAIVVKIKKLNMVLFRPNLFERYP